jgi:hypothetical protein
LTEIPSTERRVYSPAELYRYAQVAEQAGRSDEAERLFRLLWESTRAREGAMLLSLFYERAKRWAESEAAAREGLAVNPDDAALERQLAFLLLRHGRFTEAWPHYEARWRVPGDRRRPALNFPEWKGERVKSLLIWPEQGIGDQIQYIRYARMLKDRAFDVSVFCSPMLRRLFEHLSVRVVAAEPGVSPPRCDAWVLLASLPGLFKTTVETIPPAPYLPSKPSGRGVGLVSKGSPGHVNDRNRSLPDEVAAEIAGWDGVKSLQIEDTGAADLEETRQLMNQHELIITVDTSAAHLAGAMGKPCWLLLPYAADWRWMEERSDSPWYPSIRIFRQPKAGDWASVLVDLKAAFDNRPARKR